MIAALAVFEMLVTPERAPPIPRVVIPETAPEFNVTPPIWFDVAAPEVIPPDVFSTVPLNVSVPLGAPEIDEDEPFATRMLLAAKFDVNATPGPVNPVNPVNPVIPVGPVQSGPVNPVNPVNPVIPV